MTSSFWSLSNVHFIDLHPKNDDIAKMKNEVTKHQMSFIGVLSIFLCLGLTETFSGSAKTLLWYM